MGLDKGKMRRHKRPHRTLILFGNTDLELGEERGKILRARLARESVSEKKQESWQTVVSVLHSEFSS